MTVYPEGTATAEGVSFVRACVEALRKQGASHLTVAKNAKEIAERCNLAQNPSSYRLCQVEAATALPGLARLAATNERDEIRIRALEAVAVVLFGANEDAAAHFWGGDGPAWLVQALLAALSRASEVNPLERAAACYCLLTLSFLSGSLEPLRPTLVPVWGLLLDGTVARPVRADALAVLSSFAGQGDEGAAAVAAVVDAVVLGQLGGAGEEELLTVGMLLASLLCHAPAAAGELRALERERGLSRHLHDALAAALQREEWPAGSRRFPPVARLVRCSWLLASHGFREELLPVVPLLADAAELGEAENEALGALRVLAEIPEAFPFLEARAAFFKNLSGSKAADDLRKYCERRMQGASSTAGCPEGLAPAGCPVELAMHPPAERSAPEGPQQQTTVCRAYGVRRRASDEGTPIMV